MSGERPVVFVVDDDPSVPMTVRAMKAGAAEFLTKPFDDQVLLDAIYGRRPHVDHGLAPRVWRIPRGSPASRDPFVGA